MKDQYIWILEVMESVDEDGEIHAYENDAKDLAEKHRMDFVRKGRKARVFRKELKRG